MRYGINLPVLGEYADPRLLAEMAREAESAGWDGVFVWDHILVSNEAPLAVTDPWIALAAIALCTERVKIGPMITPLARRDPYVLAREVITLDHLSGGRVILGAGLGAPAYTEFEIFGEESDPKVRARKLDEGLDVVMGLCSGEPFRYTGEYYQLPETRFALKPVQERIPVWIAGWWPNKGPMRRAARWDGAYPVEVDTSGSNPAFLPMAPDTVRSILAYIAQHRSTSAPFDMVIECALPIDDSGECAAIINAYAEAGVTWLIHDFIPWEASVAEAWDRIRQGPPKV